MPLRFVGGTVPGYAWGEGKGERAAVRSKKFKRGRFRDSVYHTAACFLCPSIFPLLLLGGVFGPGGFRQYWHRSLFICRNLWVGGQDAPRERGSSDVRGLNAAAVP